MKKIIICTILLIIATGSFSQQTKLTPTLTKQDYLLKSKHQKTAAWVLLSSGFVLSTTSSLIMYAKATVDVVNFFPGVITGDPAPTHNYTTESILLLSGIAAMLSSVPFFVASSKNKKKAMSLSFKNEASPQIYKSSFVYKPVPSLTLKINL